MRILLVTLLLAACNKAEPPKQTEVTVEVAPKPAPRPAKARKDVLAEKILGAIAADDFEQLRPLFRMPGVPATETDPLADLTREGFPKLRAKLDQLHIDLAKAKLLRVEMTGDAIGMFDVFLEANGRVYQTHFSAMDRGGQYYLLGIANWIVPEGEMTKN